MKNQLCNIFFTQVFGVPVVIDGKSRYKAAKNT